FLYDIRETISELTIDNFYGIMSNRAHDKGMQFSAESVAPTMLSDGMQHHGVVDVPMGEFWLRSPTHDKPNDMLDAVSGAHIYGKNIIQAEGFTELRLTWDEHPGNIKTLLDRNYALGFNRLFFHVYMHNPWIDRKPGMTLGTVGLFFQRDQTWWKEGKALVEYTEKCQKLLQMGKPVVDVAVFTGEGLPRRSVLPDRLVETLPGIMGEAKVAKEKERLKNFDQPTRVLPITVKHAANMSDPEDWLDPLNGYKYDSFNKDALLNLTSVKGGKISLSSGASYELLVLPQSRRMDPNPEYMSVEVLTKLTELVKQGATLMISDMPHFAPGLQAQDAEIQKLAAKIWEGNFEESDKILNKKLGKGTIVKAPYVLDNFEPLGLSKDFVARENNLPAKGIGWMHRRDQQKEIYFISNQTDKSRSLDLSLRTSGRKPMVYDPVTDRTFKAKTWKVNSENTEISIELYPTQAVFIIFEEPTNRTNQAKHAPSKISEQEITGSWQVTFNPDLGGPDKSINMDQLQNWIEYNDPKIKYYSGTASYATDFEVEDLKAESHIELNGLYNIASVTINGEPCGVVWTPPYHLDVSKALRKGTNHLEIQVTNTWRNRLLRDHMLPKEKQLTWTTAPPFYLEDLPLLSAGLVGPVKLLKSKN
ncbi:MAG: glycosyl hydrolase, partial [Cyclobacteriaceae bacterium]